MYILYFDKDTRLFKSFIQTTSPDSLQDESEYYLLLLDDEEAVAYHNKWNQLKLKDDYSIEEIPVKPSQYHFWNGTEWQEDLEKKIEIESFNARDYRLFLLKQIDELVMNPFRLASLTDEIKTELSSFRQDLLDVPQQANFPLEIVWPKIPSILM